MPRKGHKMSESHKKRISEANKGRVVTETTRKKMSMSLKGKKQSEESKKKKSEAMKGKHVGEKHPFYGGIQSEESKKKISNALKGKKQSEEHIKKRIDNMKKNGTKFGMPLGSKHTEESKKKMSQTKINFFKDSIVSEETRKKISLKRLQQKPQPKGDTLPEKLLQKILKDNKINFETQKAILGIPDIFINPNFCIFVDSDYHHANPKKYPDETVIWKEYNRKGRFVPEQTAKMIRDRDMRVNIRLEKKGYKILRFWVTELYANPEKCLKNILKFVNV